MRKTLFLVGLAAALATPAAVAQTTGGDGAAGLMRSRSRKSDQALLTGGVNKSAPCRHTGLALFRLVSCFATSA
jgi:hypothetical protein